MKFFNLPYAKFTLDHWKPTTMSVRAELSIRLSITVSEVPAHLCTPKIISFILSPYCAVENTIEDAQLMPTSEQLKCTAWTNLHYLMPRRIMAALLTKLPEEYASNDSNQTRLENNIVAYRCIHHSTQLNTLIPSPTNHGGR